VVPTSPDRRGEMAGKKLKYHAVTAYCRAVHLHDHLHTHAGRGKNGPGPHLNSPAGKELHTAGKPVSTEFSDREGAASGRSGPVLLLLLRFASFDALWVTGQELL
jgi:hypothetical protein